jgi:hypothetical protein
MRALCLAHMDAYLKGNGEAFEFLDGEAAAAFERRGIGIEISEPVVEADAVA